MSRALYRVYNELDIRCCYFEKCNRTVKMCDLEGHENNCAKVKCFNYLVCEADVAANKMFRGRYCSPECYLTEFIR
jgi:hypothetical protein